MAENVRDVIRAAQAAELGGDKPRAIELLRRAATMYRRAGSFTRAEQLLRYALRLDSSLTDELEEEIRRLSEVTQATSDVQAWAGEESSPDTSAPAPDEDPESGVWVHRGRPLVRRPPEGPARGRAGRGPAHRPRDRRRGGRAHHRAQHGGVGGRGSDGGAPTCGGAPA